MVMILEKLNAVFQKIKNAYIFLFLVREESGSEFDIQIQGLRERIGKASEDFKFLSELLTKKFFIKKDFSLNFYFS